MRRLPTSLPDPVRRLLRWLDGWDGVPLEPASVPGASPKELSRLAALGSLAHALVPVVPESWPEQLRSWAADSKPLDPVLAEELRAMVGGGTGASGGDVLALLYEWVVDGKNRRWLGTFFTPTSLTRHMVANAEAVLGVVPTSVVDPGAGVGAFSVAAHTAWPRATVTAVDVNVVTLGLLAARMLPASGDQSPRLSLVQSDYLAWLAERWPEIRGPRLILGNPPYTRHQHLPSAAKAAARTAAGPLVTSGLAGLSAYFLAASLLALGDEDALCLLLPGSWCETRYGREVREWLWKQHHRAVDVQLFPSDMAVFPGTQVTAMVLAVGPRRRTPQPLWVRRADLDPDGAGGRVVFRRSVPCDRTAACPATFTGVLAEKRKVSLQELPLSDNARVRRGVATGASDFFFLDDASRDRLGLPQEALRAALVKPGHATSPHLTAKAHARLGAEGKPRWLLDLNGGDLATSDRHVAEYLAYGRSQGVHKRYLTRHRPDWHTVEPVDPPDVLLSPVGKTGHRVIVNDVRAVGSNNFYGIYLAASAPWTAGALAGWLRCGAGQAALMRIARSYQGGSMKIEPRALRGLLVPTGLSAPRDGAG